MYIYIYIGIYMYQYLHSHTHTHSYTHMHTHTHTSDNKLQHLFPHTDVRNPMLLRKHPHQLDLPKPHSDLLEFSFRYRTVKHWNVLPEHIVSATSITTFKHLLLPHLCITLLPAV